MLLYDRIRAAFADPPLPDDIPIISADTIQQRIDQLPDDTPQPTAADPTAWSLSGNGTIQRRVILSKKTTVDKPQKLW